MLMGFSGGALPSRVTLPATEPVVVASTVFPAGAVVAAGCSAVGALSLLPHPVMARAMRAASERLNHLLLMLENSSLAELHILTRSGTDGGRILEQEEPARRRRSWLLSAGLLPCSDVAGGGRAGLQCCLLLGGQGEHVTDQEVGLISVILLHGAGRGAGEDPDVAFFAEKAGRHGSAGNNFRGIGDPAGGPCGLQALVREQEIRRRSILVVRFVAGHVALQARRSGTGEQAASHGALGVCERLDLRGNKRVGLRRHRFEK